MFLKGTLAVVISSALYLTGLYYVGSFSALDCRPMKATVALSRHLHLCRRSREIVVTAVVEQN